MGTFSDVRNAAENSFGPNGKPVKTLGTKSEPTTEVEQVMQHYGPKDGSSDKHKSPLDDNETIQDLKKTTTMHESVVAYSEKGVSGSRPALVEDYAAYRDLSALKSSYQVVLNNMHDKDAMDTAAGVFSDRAVDMITHSVYAVGTEETRAVVDKCYADDEKVRNTLNGYLDSFPETFDPVDFNCGMTQEQKQAASASLKDCYLDRYGKENVVDRSFVDKVQDLVKSGLMSQEERVRQAENMISGVSTGSSAETQLGN